MQGPPFSVAEREVHSLFADAQVKQIGAQDVLTDNPRFRDKGLTRLLECAYLIKQDGA
jgi:thiopurine S-methyltransferase